MINKVLPKPPSSNRQIQEYMSAVRKGINSQFIIFIDTGRWSLQPAINPKKSTIYASKDLALNEARKNAQHTRGDIFIFNDKDGSLIAEVKT